MKFTEAMDLLNSLDEDVTDLAKRRQEARRQQKLQSLVIPTNKLATLKDPTSREEFINDPRVLVDLRARQNIEFALVPYQFREELIARDIEADEIYNKFFAEDDGIHWRESGEDAKYIIQHGPHKGRPASDYACDPSGIDIICNLIGIDDIYVETCYAQYGKEPSDPEGMYGKMLDKRSFALDEEYL